MMKNLKLFALAVAAAALMALAGVGSASATELTCGEAMCAAETTIEAANEGEIILDAPFGNVACKKSTVKGHTTKTGGASETVSGPITTLTFTECGSNTVTVLATGSLEIHGIGSSNGTLTSSGTRVTTIHLGVHCIAETLNTDLGTLTGSATTGGNATLDISARIPITEGEGGAFCGSSAPWTGSYKFTAPSTLNIDEGGSPPPPKLDGEAPTGFVGETVTVTWKNTGESSVTVNDEIDSAEAVAETTGTACGAISAGGSCTSRKVKCLKKGEATLTARATASGAEGQFTIKCDEPGKITGEAPTANVGETVTVTWKNTGGSSVTIDDETNSNGEVTETLGSGCGTISASGSCTSRKVKCLKKGETTLTARDTPSVEGSVVVKCDEPPLSGSPTTANVGETITVTWKNNTEGALVIEDETISDATVAETLGSSCGEIAATGSCTNRKIKCLKAGESTITAADTPSTEGKFTIKCD